MAPSQPRGDGRARLSELMSTEVVTLSPGDTLREAIEVLTTQGISGAPVVVGSSVVGVLSATDILELERSMPGVPTERPDQTEWGEWGPAAEWVEGEEPPASYFLELWQDAGTAVDERFRETAGPEWDVLEEHTVGEAMSRSLCALPPEATLQEASTYMVRSGVHRVLVMDGERLLGVVSTTDVVRAVAAAGGGEPASAPPEVRPESPPLETGHARGGFVIGPTDQGGDVGFRPDGVRGLDEW